MAGMPSHLSRGISQMGTRFGLRGDSIPVGWSQGCSPSSVMGKRGVLATHSQDSDFSARSEEEKVFGTRGQAPQPQQPRGGFSVGSCYRTACFSQIIIHQLFKPPSVSQSDFVLNSGSLKNMNIFIIYFVFKSEGHLYTSVVYSLLPFWRQGITIFTSTINLTRFTILNQVMGLFSLSALRMIYISL